MRFAFTDDQYALRDAVRDLLAKECPPSEVTGAWTNATGRTARAWEALRAMGVLDALVPEADGGLGLTVLDLVLVCEEAGRVALPEPFLEHAVVAAPVVGSGRTSLTAVVGQMSFAAYADTADAVLVQDGDRLLLVPAPVLVLEPEPSVDRARRVFSVDWSGSDAAVEVGGPAACAAAIDRATLGRGAFLLGLAQHLLDATVEYASARHQFGVPIGSFQAIKHKLADVRIALEFARPLVHRAASSVATGDPEASVHVSMAAAQSIDAALLAARHALQCHGAIGYSYEHDLHHWMKRVWALARAGGDASWHREQVARAILDRT